MLSVIIFLFTISTQNHFSTTKSTDSTAPIKTRIEILKKEILEKINEGKENIGRDNPAVDSYSDIYEYVDIGNKPITPIMDSDKRKLKKKYNLPEIISRPTEKYVASDTSEDKDDDRKLLRSKKHKHKYDKKLHKPKEIFYRKMFADEQERNKPQKWTHCLELLTPYLNGYKDEITFKRISTQDGTVVRLSHLLTLNTTDYNKEEIRSILYQISNLQLRLFQWDIDAIKFIFRVIMDGREHNFGNLKHGVKAIFAKWKMDTSDISSFLKQSRIFRPPCIAVSLYDGSTQSSKAIRYTTPENKCQESDDEKCTA